MLLALMLLALMLLALMLLALMLVDSVVIPSVKVIALDRTKLARAYETETMLTKRLAIFINQNRIEFSKLSISN
jgi:hypothetical protein